MGTTKKKTVANVSVTRMIEDADIPDIVKLATIDYIASDKDLKVRTSNNSVNEYISLYLANTMPRKYRRIDRWIDNKYSFDRPTAVSSNTLEVDIEAALTTYIESTTGRTITLEYALFQGLNNPFFAWHILNFRYGYNPNTNEVTNESAINGFPTYLSNAQVYLCQDTVDNLIDNETVFNYGMAYDSGYTPYRAKDESRPNSQWLLDAAATVDYVEYSFVYEEVIETLITPPPPEEGEEEQEPYIEYTYVEHNYNKIENFLEWEFSGVDDGPAMGEGVGPSPDPSTYTPPVVDRKVNAEYFQACYTYDVSGVTKRAYFMHEYELGGTHPLDLIFGNNALIGSYLPNIFLRLNGLDMASDGLKDTEQYKDSKKLCWLLDLNFKELATTIQEGIGELDKVRQIHITTALNVNNTDDLSAGYFYSYFYKLFESLPEVAATAKYAATQAMYNLTNARAGLFYTVTDSSNAVRIGINAIGYREVTGVIGDIGKVVTVMDNVNNSTGLGRPTVVSTIHSFRKQITSDMYREVSVHGLSVTQSISGGYTTTFLGLDEGMLIPLDASLTNLYEIKQRNILYSRALHVVVGTTQVVKTKWYARSAFKIVLFIASAVLAFFTGGASLSVTAVLMAIVNTVIISIVVNLVIKLVVVKWGIDLKVVAAVIAVAALVYGGQLHFSGTTTGIFGATSANLVAIANYSFMASNFSFQVELQKLVEGMQEFYEDLTSKYVSLRELREEQGLDVIKSQGYLIKDPINIPKINLGEFPNQYLDRFFAAPTIGLLSSELIENFVDISTTLPTFTELMLKGNKDG